MKAISIIKVVLENYSENELIFASKLYREKLCGEIEEAAFYKALERMCKTGELTRIAKGTYHLPKRSKYGTVPPSEREIVSAFTKNGLGTVIGYSLYNSLNLTTQIPKTINILSSAIDGYSKSIRNVVIHRSNLDYTEAVENMVHGLEVLQNFSSIQDINYDAFYRFAHNFALKYTDEDFKTVIEIQNYKKNTISFMRNILDYFHVNNQLGKYLSSMSDYKHPRMEDIYEAARIV